MIAPNFLGAGTNRNVTESEKLKIKNYISRQCKESYGVNNSIESLLIKLNSVTSYEEIPDVIMFSYKNLIERNLDFKQTLDLVDLTAKLATAKFNKKPKEIWYTGFLSGNFSISDHYEKIVSAGFVGCAVSPLAYGIDTAEDYSCKAKKDRAYWSPIALAGKNIIVSKLSPIEITLTFRQEQILQLILKGMTNCQISRRLNLSESTVKMHIGMILKKYGVRDRTQLIFSLSKKMANQPIP